MFCSNCGKEIDDKAVICVHCGAAIKSKKSKKSPFKKWWVWLIIAIIMIGIISSATTNGSNNTTIVNNSNSTNIEEDKNANESPRRIKSGDKIVSDDMEVTINSVELTYDVLPDDTSGFYTHYEADSGKIYISVDAAVTNKAKQNLACDKIGKVIANYNDGYTYSGFVIVDDSSTGFTYANITNVNPLETKGIKWLIECPQEIEKTKNSLFLEFTFKSEKYIYIIR